MQLNNVDRRWILSLFFTFIAICPMTSFSAQKFTGQINLWRRPICVDGKNCPLPQAFGSTWNIDIELPRPTQPGTSTVKSVPLTQDGWNAVVSLYWVLPPAPERDYIVSQFKLTHAVNGFVFECSRYDAPEMVEGFPTGACSGRVGSEQIGIATKKFATTARR
jgi:hypothetical protein